MTQARRGQCNEPGPWGTICTDHPGHRYSHFDSGKGNSWQDDWKDDTPIEGGGTLQEDPKPRTRLEAAAKAIFDVRDDPYDNTEWHELHSADREPFECQARAALAAADGFGNGTAGT
ncbi:hypothetical protein ACIPY3_03270 [Paenarthrobacter sp. NPDC089714]|uniref:hypothetical protein n=1 Tax=Paenarthrobacter sp. NPDC089714 TaxID=3364377 RepID=UPI003806033E